MPDWHFALALFALLALILLREAFLFIPVLGSALWQLPILVLAVIPGAPGGVFIAAAWCIPFIWFFGLMGFWGIKIVLGLVFAVWLSMCVSMVTAAIYSVGIAPPPQTSDAAQGMEAFHDPSMFSAALVMVAITAVLGLCLFSLPNRCTETVSELILGAKQYLRTRGQALLLFVTLLCYAAILLVYLIVGPLIAAMMQSCGAQGNTEYGTQDAGLRFDSLDDFKASAASATGNLSCRPFLDALLPGWVSGATFGVLAVFLLTWLFNLLYHVLIFVSATVGAEDRGDATAPPSSFEEASVDSARVQSAAMRCLFKSFGSLCFSSLITTSLFFITPSLGYVFQLPVLNLVAPIVNLASVVATAAFSAVLIGYVVPIMAILETPFLDSLRKAIDLVQENLAQVLLLEVCMGAIASCICFVCTISAVIFCFIFLGLCALAGYVGAVASIFAVPGGIALICAFVTVYRTVICSKFVLLALEGKVPSGSDQNPLVFSGTVGF